MRRVRVERRAGRREPGPREVPLLGPRGEPAPGAGPRRGAPEGARRRVRAREPGAGAGRRGRGGRGERGPRGRAGGRRERREGGLAGLPRGRDSAPRLVQRWDAPLKAHRHLLVGKLKSYVYHKVGTLKINAT